MLQKPKPLVMAGVARDEDTSPSIGHSRRAESAKTSESMLYLRDFLEHQHRATGSVLYLRDYKGHKAQGTGSLLYLVLIVSMQSS